MTFCKTKSIIRVLLTYEVHDEKMGRPKGENNKACTCTIRMDNNTYKKLEDFCKEKGFQKSEVIRLAINELFDKYDYENLDKTKK